MRVALDAQLAIGTATGIGEYVRGLSDALRGDGVELVALAEPRLDPWRFDRRVLWDQVLLPQRARRAHADVLHCASGTVPLRAGCRSWRRCTTSRGCAFKRTLGRTRATISAAFRSNAIAAARRSPSTRSSHAANCCRCWPDTSRSACASSIPGVARDFCDLPRAAGDRRTILAVGTVERRKNLAALIRLLPQLDRARIISVGPATPYRSECAQLATSLSVADRIEFRGYVERRELLELYASCAVVAVPSTYEGFGYAAAQVALRRHPLHRLRPSRP